MWEMIEYTDKLSPIHLQLLLRVLEDTRACKHILHINTASYTRILILGEKVSAKLQVGMDLEILQ